MATSEPLVAWIVALIPLRRVKDMLRTGLQRLPPPLALLVFVVPAAVLFPLKLLSVLVDRAQTHHRGGSGVWFRQADRRRRHRVRV